MRFEKSKYKSQKQTTVFAKKSFGQNFLVDPNYISKIISALAPKESETIIEIGAGRGALTRNLINSGANVIAVELDKDLIPVLQKEFGEYKNFEIVENDALKLNFQSLIAQRSPLDAKLVANLPYYISTAILQKLIEEREAFSEMILMFQREVVERISAKPGSKDRGFLTVLVEAYLETEKLFDVPPNAFRPIPKVESAVARFKKKEKTGIKNESFFKEIISCGFRQKRKTLLNNLKNAPEILYKNREPKFDLAASLEKINIDPNRRAETLTLGEWVELTDFFDRND